MVPEQEPIVPAAQSAQPSPEPSRITKGLRTEVQDLIAAKASLSAFGSTFQIGNPDGIKKGASLIFKEGNFFKFLLFMIQINKRDAFFLPPPEILEEPETRAVLTNVMLAAILDVTTIGVRRYLYPIKVSSWLSSGGGAPLVDELDSLKGGEAILLDVQYYQVDGASGYNVERQPLQAHHKAAIAATIWPLEAEVRAAITRMSFEEAMRNRVIEKAWKRVQARKAAEKAGNVDGAVN